MFILIHTSCVVWSHRDLPQPCDSKIYCKGGEGSLLHTVQMARITKDSKTFVDQPVKTTVNDVLINFQKIMAVNSDY